MTGRLSRADARKKRKADKQAKEDAKRSKTPTTTVEVPAERVPTPGPPVTEDPKATISFRFGRTDVGGPWCFSKMTEADWDLVSDSCRSWETLTPTEFRNLPRVFQIPKEKMISKAQKRIAEIGLEDYDGLWHLDPQGKPRIWGLLHHHIFYFVWWDPEHEVCPSALKNT